MVIAINDSLASNTLHVRLRYSRPSCDDSYEEFTRLAETRLAQNTLKK